jgi:UDP-glucose:(heptosyl)LPS alpha-1,3-glucosyltransferase
MNPTKLCIIRRNSGIGGAERVAERFAEFFAEDFEVFRMWAGERFHGHTIVGSRGEAWWRSWRYTRQLDGWHLKRDHVVFSMEYGPECDIYRAGDGVHRLNVLRRYGNRKTWMLNPWHWMAPRLERKSLESARVIVANSHLVAGLLAAEYPHLKSRIQVIHNGFDPRAFAPSAQPKALVRQQLGLPAAGLLLLLAGSGFRRKGLHHAIELLHRLQQHGTTAHLVVVGKGNPAYVRSLIDSYGLESAVHFFGFVPSVARYYQAADFMVLPTRHDPFSNACLEALACGCPVITSSENGAAEVLTERTGFVFSGQQYDDPEFSACEGFIRGFNLDPRDVAATVARNTVQREIADYRVLVRSIGKEKGNRYEATE